MLPALEKYEFVQHIGQGGYGNVYVARTIRNRKLVAVKVAQKTKRRPTTSLAREWQIYNMIRNRYQHPHIASAIEFCNLRDHEAIVMEYLPHSLHTSRDSMTRTRVLSLGRHMIDCLEELHSFHIVHGDISVRNFMFSDASHSALKLIDFGVSTTFRDAQSLLSQSFKGTLTYASISMHKSEPPHIHQDIQSVCYVILDLMLGKKELPWKKFVQPLARQNNKKFAAMKQRILDEKEALNIASVCTTMPDAMVDFVSYCLGLPTTSSDTDICDLVDYEYLRKLLLLAEKQQRAINEALNEEIKGV